MFFNFIICPNNVLKNTKAKPVNVISKIVKIKFPIFAVVAR